MRTSRIDRAACFGAILALACLAEGNAQTLGVRDDGKAVTESTDWIGDHIRRAATLPPEQELEKLLQLIGESHFSASWPTDFEGRIQDWVDAGDASAQPPFDDRYGIVTPAFFQRLRELRQSLGGWLYWSDEQDRVVFAPDSEWRQIRAARDAKRAALVQEMHESFARAERALALATTLADAARQDLTLWAALKAWTLRQDEEMKQRARSQAAANQGLSGPVAIMGRKAKSERPWYTQPEFDPSYVEFIERSMAGEDNQTKFMVATHIWFEARIELGLTKGPPR